MQYHLYSNKYELNRLRRFFFIATIGKINPTHKRDCTPNLLYYKCNCSSFVVPLLSGSFRRASAIRCFYTLAEASLTLPPEDGTTNSPSSKIVILLNMCFSSINNNLEYKFLYYELNRQYRGHLKK